MSVQLSVVVPAYNAERTLGDTLRSLEAQSVARSAYEIIVVDDGSSDGTAALAASSGARVIRQANAGAAAARNAGAVAANAEWVAFTDADCVASRGWLKAFLRRIAAADADAICVAGKTLGLASDTPAARFVDLMGAFDAERHLSHPRFPFAPSGNVCYRRAALLAVGGFDTRFRSYEACELHQRLARTGGRCSYEPAALVFHRHRASWRDYWRQQRSYGGGLAQFMRAHRGEIRWSLADEARAWAGVVTSAVRAILPATGDEQLLRRGTFVRSFAQRLGFVAAYWSA